MHIITKLYFFNQQHPLEYYVRFRVVFPSLDFVTIIFFTEHRCQPGRPGRCIYVPPWHCGSVIPAGTKPLFNTVSWRYSNSHPHRDLLLSMSQYVTTFYLVDSFVIPIIIRLLYFATCIHYWGYVMDWWLQFGIHLDCRSQSASYSVATKCHYPEGCEADHSLPGSAKVKNAWSYTSTPYNI
jgi:hypothetical protein